VQHVIVWPWWLCCDFPDAGKRYQLLFHNAINDPPIDHIESASPFPAIMVGDFIHPPHISIPGKVAQIFREFQTREGDTFGCTHTHRPPPSESFRRFGPGFALRQTASVSGIEHPTNEARFSGENRENARPFVPTDTHNPHGQPSTRANTREH
jgi:hypothetical protein